MSDRGTMKNADDEHQAAQEPRIRVRIKRLDRTNQTIPEPGPFQPALSLDGYPVPHPDDTKAHLEMAYELAREIIEQARIAEQAKERLRKLDDERYQARSLAKGWGTREEREKRMLREVGRGPRDEADIEEQRREAMRAEADAAGRRCAAAAKLHRYHGEILPMCRVIGAALAITGGGLGSGPHDA